MLNWLLRRRIDAFEREWDYDATYMRELLAADRAGFMKFSLGSLFAHHRPREAPPAAVFAAGLASALHEDCGPCAQLGVTMGERGGVSPETIRALLRGDRSAGDPVAWIGFDFAQAVLRHDDDEADRLRAEIERRWGRRALASIALTLTGIRMFPTLKAALGHARECRRLQVAGEPVVVRPALEPVAA
jgi:hypothetical protein